MDNNKKPILLPSNKLLNKILGNRDFYNIELYNSNAIKYSWKSSIDGSEVTDFINIYELAHKCKEWARGRYSISSYPTYFGYGASLTDAFGNSPKNLIISTKTECGAIFKACEWIMNQN